MLGTDGAWLHASHALCYRAILLSCVWREFLENRAFRYRGPLEVEPAASSTYYKAEPLLDLGPGLPGRQQKSPAGRQQVARSPGRQVARSPAVASGRQWVASKVASRGVCAWQPQVASRSPGRQQVARSPGRSPGRQPGLKQCVSLQVWISHLSCTLQSPLLYFVDFNVFSHNIQPQTQLP